MQLNTTVEGGEHMTIYDLIDDETRRKLNAKKPVVHRPKRNKEQLSTCEWENIMGKNRDIYKRVNGKVKRK